MKDFKVILVMFFCIHGFTKEINDLKRQIIEKSESTSFMSNMVNTNKESQNHTSRPVFLRANWIHLIIVNFEMELDILKPYIPAGTVLDFYNGKTYISLVAFLFENTKVLGIIPAFFHQDFEEINLRFYVLRNENGRMKRGVVFIKEIVPKALLAWMARTVYHENYVAMPTSHHIINGSHYQYQWGNSKITVKSNGRELNTQKDSFERWITEHYWGYTRVNSQKTLEYEVKHPIWNLYEVTNHHLEGDFTTLYGQDFQPYLKGNPSSVILAQGSEVTVHWPTEIKP